MECFIMEEILHEPFLHEPFLQFSILRNTPYGLIIITKWSTPHAAESGLQ